jgi:hypothetical protein
MHLFYSLSIDDGLFHFKLELRAFSVAIVLYIYTIKTKTINGRVSVYKQIVGLYVINNLIFLMISRIHQQVQLIVSI